MLFTRSDRRSMLLLIIVLLAIMAGMLLDRWLLHPLPQPVTLDQAVMDTLEQAWGGEVTIGQGAASDAPAVSGPVGAASSRPYAAPVTYQPETFPFDPNTADSTTLLRLGLAPWQVRNIYRYRARGGRYHRPEDFKRLYGMTPELWERLSPVIRIDRKYRYFTASELSTHTADSMPAGTTSRDTASPFPRYPRQEKFTTLTLVDLNTADTTLLKHIPGIASYRARQIIRYRERLGGFVSVDQLSEVTAIPEELHQWFKVETPILQRLNVNTATVTQLGRHPYIGFPRARAIENYRRVHGHIQNLSDLRLLPEFSDDVLLRLKPYVEY